MKKLVSLAAVLSLGAWCNPKPTPTPTPSPEPTVPSPVCVEGQTCGCWHQPPGEDWQQLPPCPTPTPVPTPTPTPVPTPTPSPGQVCPKALAPSAVVYMKNKPYGQGLDSTVRVKGDPEFCRIIQGLSANDCHLEGWPQRSECEMFLIGGCPVWEFSTNAGTTAQPCVDDQYAQMSCDHLGSVQYRDDPKTPEFEGRPVECGNQRDEHGPIAGFFTVAHGAGLVRACKPDKAAATCGSWQKVDH